jgi:predicted peptidase
MTRYFFYLCLSLSFTAASAQTTASFEKKEFIRSGDTLRYRIQYPLRYNHARQYPLVLLLHGSGERGNDNEAQLKWGGDLFADSGNRANYPAIVIFPQCPSNSSWAQITGHRDADSSRRFEFLSDQPMGKPLTLLMALTDSLLATGLVNSKKVYIGGLSMGGMGTYEMLWRRPHFFAAAFPICGAGDTSKVVLYAKKFPIWIFHGEKDPAVAVTYDRSMSAALKAAGANLIYTEYPGVGHDSWKNAFADPHLLEWVFKQKR